MLIQILDETSSLVNYKNQIKSNIETLWFQVYDFEIKVFHLFIKYMNKNMNDMIRVVDQGWDQPDPDTTLENKKNETLGNK